MSNDNVHREQETKRSSTVTGPAETSEHESEIGTQDGGENIGGRSAGGIAGTGGVGTNDVGGKGPGKSIDSDRGSMSRSGFTDHHKDH